ncbi:MAG: cob(I)yrinic acid a,c-diamide adenosyltransferase [Deltaproteobacteria bacterium]|nr:cob(I)yrinic acid a,c-diamide adenosyltransferase [Deltaproteobacteria bacterium]
MKEKGWKKGMVHVYTGDGKGKTTAAVGLAVRAAGCGLRVIFVQFFKLDDDPSGEKEIFRKNIPSIELVRSNLRHPMFTGKAADMEAIKRSVRDAFELARMRVGEGFDIIVLDEIMGAINGGFIGLEDVVGFIDARPEGLEVVLTGRNAPAELVKRADYVTEFLDIKHPYAGGTGARKGIEF